jgi:hypothetical protein
MSRPTRLAAGAAVALLLTAGIGALSRVPYEADSADHALLRLAWRVRGARVEECRRLTPEELERTPPHMRRDEVCEGRVLPYRLIVTVDGQLVVDDSVHAAGARADRPLYVSRDVPVTPGTRRLAVRFERSLVPAVDSTPASEVAPPALVFESAITLASKEVALLSYDPASRRLVLRGYGEAR